MIPRTSSRRIANAAVSSTVAKQQQQGITYSVMSASWDEDREGEFWGVEEFQRNVGNLQEGLQRSKDNAVLRDRLAAGEVSMQDVQRLEKKQSPKTLSEKLQQDGLD